jgi:hypothetical protein
VLHFGSGAKRPGADAGDAISIVFCYGVSVPSFDERYVTNPGIANPGLSNPGSSVKVLANLWDHGNLER